MVFHYDNNGKSLCNMNIEKRYLDKDWSIIECSNCRRRRDSLMGSDKLEEVNKKEE